MLIAIGNAGEPTLAVEAVRLLAEPSPLVRGAAVWALSQLLPPDQFAALGAFHIDSEMDESVRKEWREADRTYGAS